VDREFESRDLFGDLLINSFGSISEAGRNLRQTVSPLDIISGSIAILQALVGQSEVIKFLLIVDFQRNSERFGFEELPTKSFLNLKSFF